jgi:hypothetical protein
MARNEVGFPEQGYHRLVTDPVALVRTQERPPGRVEAGAASHAG